MATRKNFHYVLVFTQTGPVYVTSVDNASQISHWDRDKDPKALPKYYAEEIVLGLNLNGYHAVLVTSKYELYQPYNYKYYEFSFKEK
jgi:hypothetical protein